jgi:CubicO group peptidase (beta-lactamase class C family)
VANSLLSLAIILAAAVVGCDSPSSTTSDAGPAPPQATVQAAPTASAIASAVDPIIRSALTDEGIPGAAFVFVHRDRVVYAQGYGMADQQRRVAVDIERTVWPIASVTKLFTGVAALQLVDSGDLGLDQDINRYLRQLAVPAQGHPPITLAHLLKHTSGLDELPGRQFDPDKGPRPSLGEFLKGRLVRYRAPGLYTAYSSYGMALVGVAIEDASGLPYEDFVRRRILEPCGMNSARIMQRRGDEQGVATPYAIEDGQAAPVPHEWYVTTPTSSLVANAADMGRFAMLHLADGRCEGRQILSESLARSMRAQHATIHPAVPGWGYAFQLDVDNGRQLAEHGGDIGGFSSLLTLIPEERSAFFIVNHGEGNDLRFRVKRALLDALYPGPQARAVPEADPARAPGLREYQGRYRSSLACHTCPDVDPEQDFEVAVHGDGMLELWGQEWLPLERDLFVRADGERLLGFARDKLGHVAVVSGGSWRVADRLAEPPL